MNKHEQEVIKDSRTTLNETKRFLSILHKSIKRVYQPKMSNTTKTVSIPLNRERGAVSK